jgi:hypothetical protein
MTHPSIVQPEAEVVVPAPPETLVRYRHRPRIEAPPEAIRPDAGAMAAVEEFVPLVEAANEFIDAKHARNTRIAYANEFAAFEKWVAEKNKSLPSGQQLSAMPAHPATLALYLTYLATTPTRDRHGKVRNARGRSPKGIRVAVAGIAYEHKMNRRQSPHHHSDVQDILAGIANRWVEPLPIDALNKPGTKSGPCVSCVHEKCESARTRAKHKCVYCGRSIGYGTRFYTIRDDRLVHTACHDGIPPPQKAALLAVHVRAMVAAQPNRLLGVRNKALLLIQWAGALRRSELCALTVEQCAFSEKGLTITLGKTKTDKTGSKRKPKAISVEADEDVCPVRALKAWLDAARISSGFIFLHVDRWQNLHQRLYPGTIAKFIKAWGVFAGLDAKTVSGHSPRAGFVTEATRARKRLDKIMDVTGHTETDTVMG